MWFLSQAHVSAEAKFAGFSHFIVCTREID
jgi:hypothetical protein